MQRESYDVLVVGAGVIGCAVAYYGAKAGLRVALVEKGRVAGEASGAGAGMLAPLDEDASDPQRPFQQLCLAGLRSYRHLAQELKQETGIDIEQMAVPTLRPAFHEQERAALQSAQEKYRHLLPGLQWLEGDAVRKVEPLLPETVQSALLSPAEWNIQVTRLTLAYAEGAALRGARIFEGRPAGRFIRQGQRLIGMETEHGPLYTEAVVLAAGAWAGRWHAQAAHPPIFPVKGQMIALRPPPGLRLRHTIYSHGLGGIVPKADGSVYVGATAELAGFDKTVTAAGVTTLLAIVATLAPPLRNARFERAWAGLRPGSADQLPLIGPSRTLPGLWLAGGHFRDGILLGPITGQVLAKLLQGRPAPFDLNLFDPDRFGGWDRAPTPDKVFT